MKNPLIVVSVVMVASVGFGLSLAAHDASIDRTAAEKLDLFYTAIGGRDVWAEGHGEYVLAKVEDPRFPLPATFEFCWSWDEPRAADRSRFQDLTQTRALQGDTGWTFNKPSGNSPGQVKEWDAARLQRGLMEWTGNFEVLAHRMAKRDPAVSVVMGEGEMNGWLAISVDGTLRSYLLLDESGAPRKFHRLFDDARVEFGPLADRGRLKFPAWGSFEGGEPFDIIAFEILDTAPTRPFVVPDATDPGYLDCR